MRSRSTAPVPVIIPSLEEAARASIEDAYGQTISDPAWEEMKGNLLAFFGLLDQWAAEDDAAGNDPKSPELRTGKIAR